MHGLIYCRKNLKLVVIERSGTSVYRFYADHLTEVLSHLRRRRYFQLTTITTRHVEHCFWVRSHALPIAEVFVVIAINMCNLHIVLSQHVRKSLLLRAPACTRPAPPWARVCNQPSRRRFDSILTIPRSSIMSCRAYNSTRSSSKQSGTTR